MSKKINYIVALTTGIIVGALSWAVIIKFFRVIEIYDTPVGSYIAMSLPTLLAFYISLTNSLVKSLLFLIGVYLATVFYPYFFGIEEHKVWVGLGVVVAFTYMFYVFVGAFVGWVVRLVYLRFFEKRATQAAQKIMAKTVELTECIPQAAYETYDYTEKASRTGYVNILFALFSAAVGVVLYLYPSPPLNPIDSSLLQTALKWLGIAFLLIALYELILSLRLILDNSTWHIAIDGKTLLYETPKSTREKSFSCRLDEIEKIEEILIKSDSDAEGSSGESIYKIILNNGLSYPLFEGRNYIDKRRVIDTLRARGIQVVERE